MRASSIDKTHRFFCLVYAQTHKIKALWHRSYTYADSDAVQWTHAAIKLNKLRQQWPSMTPNSNYHQLH